MVYTGIMSALYQSRLHVPPHTSTAQLLAFWDVFLGESSVIEKASQLMRDTVLPFVHFGAYTPESAPAFNHLRLRLFKRYDPVPFRYTTRDPTDFLMGWLRSSSENPRVFSEAITWALRFPVLFERALDDPQTLEYVCQKVLRLSGQPDAGATAVQALRLLEDPSRWSTLVRQLAEKEAA
jgi:hypothetical protein